MTDYTLEEKRSARKVLGIRDDDRTIPVSKRSVEALVDTIALQRANHQDRFAEMQGANDALRARLRAHRKAKALANKRADTAVAAMQAMLACFQKEKLSGDE